MKKLYVHRFENEKFGRFHLPFFKKFDEYLKRFFDVEVVQYNTDGNTWQGNIKLKSEGISFPGAYLSDVEYLIENPELNELKLISVTEFFNHCVSHYVNSDYCSSVLMAHYNKNSIEHWMKIEGGLEKVNKISPWVFFPPRKLDQENYRNIRNNIHKFSKFNEKLFYLGSGFGDYRKVIEILDNNGVLQEHSPSNFDQYMKKLCSSEIGISYYMDLNFCKKCYEYPGEFCYRDIEYLCVGLPYIRIEYEDQLYDNLIPNEHYISIDRELAFSEFDLNGNVGVAKLFVEKSLEVKEDKEFLSKISKNQQLWYDRNLSDENAEKLTFNLLKLSDWL